ncbi:PLP-dependent aminotransferase family protein [Gammaproteobacteria bacterium]|nr:PLP-dependent aminotransferase family protein [Gammaproteobacteria bacterium]
MAQFSTRTEQLHSSPIREILSVIDQPGMISFAGGLPSPDTFPDITTTNFPDKYLQYGPSEGEPELRKCISKQLQSIGLNCEPEQVLVLSGSQQGIDLVAKLFIDPGTLLAIESPTYLAALQAFRFFGAHFVELDISAPQELLISQNIPALAYVNPTFQNPTGHCYTKPEREALARTCDKGKITLFEDDPYRDLVYSDCNRTPICSLLKQSSWIYQSSFSKNLAPGLRLGFLVCSPDLIQYFTRLKQAADLHSNRLSQWLVVNALESTNQHENLKKLQTFYSNKRDQFAFLLEKYLSNHASWKIPAGGLFFWLMLNQVIDTNLLLSKAIKQHVAFMPGEAFFPNSKSGKSFLRLNFSHATEQEAEQGLKILATLISEARV